MKQKILLILTLIMLSSCTTTKYPLSDAETNKIIEEINLADEVTIPMAFMDRNPPYPNVCIDNIESNSFFGTKYAINFETIKYGCVKIAYFDAT